MPESIARPPAPAPARPGRTRRAVLISGAVAVLLLAGFLTAKMAAKRADAARTARIAGVRAAIARGDLPAAMPIIEALLNEHPDAPEPYELSARIALARGDFAAFDGAIARARERGGRRSGLDRLQGLRLHRAGRRAEAAPLLTAVLTASASPDPEVEQALAETYLESFDLKQAEAVLQRWAEGSPTDPTPLILLTEVDRRTSGGENRAVGHYQEALRRAPDHPEARLGLAQALAAEGDASAASEAFDDYLKLRPDDPEALVGAASNSSSLGDLDGASAYLDRALAVDPRHLDALKARAQIDLRRGDGALALERLDAAKDVDPFDSAVAYARGQALGRLGRRDEERAEIERSRRLLADNARLVELRKALDESPDDPETRLAIARWMADHGHDEEAARWAETALDLDRSHPAANRFLADYYGGLGDLGRANYYRLQARPE